MKKLTTFLAIICSPIILTACSDEVALSIGYFF
ncbi:hypothetical protein J2Z81_001593 [Virgibacillus campisalis]|uniref:Lipoprotein n=1 Tax=Virgibacillus alimentarius TaxID=698769 RepID=A0ABS4S813_9BACI|nr:hypothetical protein [Virgibacillus alimentarius]